jgi:ketosteroid isomerase-like protein
VKRWLAGALLLALATVGASTLRAASDEEKIETVLEALIEAYRTGDYDSLGRYVAPEITTVPADYAPPVQGWSNVKARYQQATANMVPAEMVRENTSIVRRGKTAWAVYQWRFAGLAGGQPIGAVGHTTLVLEKRKGNWVIVHNHTSALPTSPRDEERTSTAQPATRD